MISISPCSRDDGGQKNRRKDTVMAQKCPTNAIRNWIQRFGGQMRILAVDDDEIILELLGSALEAHDFSDVVLADCGADALRKIDKSVNDFDCFMFDIQMPGMDGIELCRRVRAMAPYRSTPIIMITAMNNKEYFDRAFMAGATDYVTKPFDLTELITRVRLADRLQTETKKVDAANDAVDALPKGSYADSVTIDEIKGVVTTLIMYNYVEQMLHAKNLSIQAIAIKIPELEVVFEGSDMQEFIYVVTDIADVISDVMSGFQVFTAYFGSGTFICIGPAGEMPIKKQIRTNLANFLNDTELVYSEDVKTNFSVVVGSYWSPKPFRKTGPQELFGSAIDKVEKADNGFRFSRALDFITNRETKRSA